MMTSVENQPMNGLIKRDLITEVISIVIRNDLVINVQDKVFLETEFRKIAHQIIDLFIFASKNLNQSAKKSKKKYKLFN